MAAVLTVDASYKDVQADENLSHLDGIVSAALAAGAVGSEADDDSDEEGGPGGMGGADAGASFNLTPYARPEQPLAASAAAPQAPLPPLQSSGGAGAPLFTADIFASGPRLRPVSKFGADPSRESSNSHLGLVAVPGVPARQRRVATHWQPLLQLLQLRGRHPEGRAGAEADKAGTAAQTPREDPVAAAQRSEKERMAAMLFGGTGPA